jgi:hypothetical protein
MLAALDGGADDPSEEFIANYLQALAEGRTLDVPVNGVLYMGANFLQQKWLDEATAEIAGAEGTNVPPMLIVMLAGVAAIVVAGVVLRIRKKRVKAAYDESVESDA